MKSFADMTDEELILELRGGQDEIVDFLMEKYKYLVRKRANAMFLIGGDTDDLIQEGMIGLFKAVRDYRMERNTSFYHFADVCITRQIYTAVEASQRMKHAPLNTYISLYSDENEETGAILLDSVKDLSETNPETLVISRENQKNLMQEMKRKLSAFESEVLDLYLEGMNYHQIAESMNKSSKAIDNALQRIRNKIQMPKQ